jgi:WD40 repeat protein
MPRFACPVLALLLALTVLTGAVAAPRPARKPAPRPLGKPAIKQAVPGKPPLSPQLSAPTPSLVPQVGHSGVIWTLAISPDGKTLVTGAEHGELRLWDLPGGRLRAILRGDMHWIWATAFSPDSQTVATGSGDGTARLWDARTGQLRATLKGHHNVLRWISFSRDGKTVATASEDATARLWEAETGQLRATLQGHSEMLWSAALSPDGRMLATASADDTARLWDVATGKETAVLQGHADAVQGVAFSPDSRIVATTSHDKTARLWDARTGQPQAVLTASSGLAPVSFSPDGATLMAGGAGVFLWDVSTRQRKAAPPDTYAGGRESVAFSANGGLLAAIGIGGGNTVSVWDTATSQLRASLSGQSAQLYALAFTPDSKLLAAAGGDRAVWLWSTETGELRAILPQNQDKAYGWAASADGKRLAVGQANRTVALWDTKNGQLLSTLRGHTETVMAASFHTDGKTLATGDRVGTVRVWNTETAAVWRTLSREGWWVGYGGIHHLRVERSQLRGEIDHTSPWLYRPNLSILPGQVEQVRIRLRVTGNGSGHFWWQTDTSRAWSEDKRIPFNIPADGNFHYINIPVGKHPRWSGQQVTAVRIDPNTAAPSEFTLAEVTLLGMKDEQIELTLPRAARWLAFTPDGKTLWASYPDGMGIRLWDLGTGELKTLPNEGAGEPERVSFSPDGQTALTHYADGEVRFWDAHSGRPRAAGRDRCGLFAYSTDGKVLATTSVNVPLRLWDAGTDQLKATLQGHTDDLLSLAFSQDGKMLAGGGKDKTARLWDTATGQLKGTFQGYDEAVDGIAFSPDNRVLWTHTPSGKALLWDVATGRLVPTTPDAPWTGPPVTAPARPVFEPGEAGGTLFDSRTGQARATLLSFAALWRTEWCVVTPQGYLDCSANAGPFIGWNVNGQVYPGDRYLERFRRPDLVRKALRGEQTTALSISGGDIPPAVRFSGLKDGDPARTNPLPVGVEVYDDRDVKGVELLVNGRPLSPEQARPIEIGARPIELGAKNVDPNHRLVKRFLFRVPLPPGSPEVRLRVMARDSSDLLSEPVEVVLKTTAAQAGAGNLYVLAVGVSRYKQGAPPTPPMLGGQGTGGRGIANLRYPAADARAVGERFGREGRPLYEKVEVRTLTDEEATLAKLREGLKWLQGKVRPSGQDTVVLFLSGHGVSLDGKYYFAPHELDPRNIAGTGLSARELREALGGKLRAKAVFLFVDTCHSGGLRGRNDDLALEVGEGVFLLASSGSREYAYESESWGHGAFTLALLRALDQKTLAREGVIHFNALTHAIPDGVADLLKEAGRSESEQEPCVPLASRRLRVPLAQP